MKIEELIIDGFKSYAVRTVISGWDPEFNAITGLNGSGKSNILDAICFVLGITNMTAVRAQNLQDLIYKRGQAGVTKASVTIVFDNSDNSRSPIGFEEYKQISVTRQIVMGGTSKYLVNGHRAQQQVVQNLFQSVQLNVNNPNFLIMQGQITKVLNMKPLEILAMIEEAAGTRMFEDRKEKALKTMAKKESKVLELNGLLKEEIEPKLDSLRTEKRAFMEFQQVQTEMERMNKVVVAYDYLHALEKLKRSASNYEDRQQRVAEIEASVEQAQRQIKALHEDLAAVQTKRENELRKGGRFEALESKVKHLSHETIRLKTARDIKSDAIKEEITKADKAATQMKEYKAALEKARQKFELLNQKFISFRQDYEKQLAHANNQDELLQTLTTGIAAKEGQNNGYRDQLQEAKRKMTEAQTEKDQTRLKIKALKAQIKKDEPQAKQALQQNSSLLNELEKLRTAAQKIEKDIEKLGLKKDFEFELQESKETVEQKLGELRVQADSIRRTMYKLDFVYTDPVPGFDKSKVKGVVATLFQVTQENMTAAVALEICAGGRLYNVVVKDETTAKLLLKAGQLKRRVTIIPLNKIATSKISDDKIEAAKSLAPGKVELALSLIEFQDELSQAMRYIFGTTFVCKDSETAKAVTFNQQIRSKCVTLEGDVYDPSGTLSGGSAPSSSNVLLNMQKLYNIETEMMPLKNKLQAINDTLSKEKNRLQEYRNLIKALDLKQHEIELGEKEIALNSNSAVLNGIENARRSISQLEQQIQDAGDKFQNAAKDVKQIEFDMDDFQSNKESKLNKLQKEVNSLRANVNEQTTILREKQKEHQDSSLEVEQLESELATATEQYDEAITSIDGQTAEVEKLNREYEETTKQHEELDAELRQEQSKLTLFSTELSNLEETIQEKTVICTEGGLELQKLRHDTEKSHKEQLSAQQIVIQLERDNPWIVDERNELLESGSPYHLAGQNIRECKTSLKALHERYESLKRKVNPKVLNMIDNVEKKETSLKNMMRTVVKDKKKIEETIDSLEEYKNEALKRTWEKVNGDFGLIFAELLPENFAKLEPSEGKTIAEGLEVKVRLGKVWKPSLTELSGGQRSLIALALIMSLLQFKPAPMYILDEVDAALDLSHTQNIGRLIKTKFKGSQFLVVSLKEGMFTNANKIYRTRFVDGTSQVSSN